MFIHKNSVALFCSLILSIAGCGTADDKADAAAAETDAGSEGFGNSNDAQVSSPTGDAAAADGGEWLQPGMPVPCGGANAAPINKVDLLFMVDNSNSMQQEQAALQAQFPKLIEVLTTGKRSPNDPHPFPPATDVHLAVVSSDMGLIGINGIRGCVGFGDDGIMRDPMQQGCEGGVEGQRFLSYKAGVTDTDELAANFGCLSNLGTGGCGFEQQLESTLKALWPRTDFDLQTGQVHVPNRISFLKDATGAGAFGHGDVENRGFLRNDPSEGLSLLAIVLVTDEEDCSSANTRHFAPMTQLAPGDPNVMVDLNLRCWKNAQNLYDIQNRYLKGFQALRAGAEDLVVYGAIVGVPPDLVNAAARAKVDFSDDAARDAYYDKILDDPRMQPKEDPDRDPGDGNLKVSCESPTGKAYPPVRIVQLAKAFGENSFVQSICQTDFGPAVDVIIDKVGERLERTCVLE